MVLNTSFNLYGKRMIFWKLDGTLTYKTKLSSLAFQQNSVNYRYELDLVVCYEPYN